MKEILIFAGTTEGRKLSEYLTKAQISHTICVATEYGEIVLNKNSFAKVHQGRMNQEDIKNFLRNERFAAVVDATHPFAIDITRNIKAAVEEVSSQGITVSYLRLKREDAMQREDNICYFQTNEACVKALKQTKGNILFTAGSKELSFYCSLDEIKKRLYVRVLPSVESLSLCIKQGICGKQIIAMQGPFTTEMNEAVIGQYRISVLVTKESGVSGGYPEKLQAAKKTGTQVFVIGRPVESEGDSFLRICAKLEKICQKEIRSNAGLEITLAGIGMGHSDCMTKEVEAAIHEADILLGAERMLENRHAGLEKHPFYRAEQIIPYLRKQAGGEYDPQNNSSFPKKVVILFSGDSGFYSGCQPLYQALEEEIRTGRINASLRILPGISSVAYLASRMGESYQDAEIFSMHGKKIRHLVHKIERSPKTFLLTSGVSDINQLGRLLVGAGMTECEITTGYYLSYDKQQIKKHTPQECIEMTEEGLYTCFIKNPYAVKRKLTHGIADGEFIRDKVPMTKEEVREVCICKLRLHENAVVYDIGSGTGAIAVEIAGLCDGIAVYAIEKKKEAVSLIEKNKEKFGLSNITVAKTEAPEGLLELPAATHAFIGGSGGRLKEILTSLYQKNPGMRVVINAVSMETICEMKEILPLYHIKGEEIVQLQVSRAKKAGNYHLMQSENPVWILAFDFTDEGMEKTEKIE